MTSVKVHAQWRIPCEHEASNLDVRVVSLVIDGERLFFRHEIIIDHRGTHYGQLDEAYRLITSPAEKRHFRHRFIGRDGLDDSAVDAIRQSATRSIVRGGMSWDRHRGPWWQLKGCRLYPLPA